MAILMILVLATAGLFAVGGIPTTGNGATAANAYLKATIGDYLYHGFIIGTASPIVYNSTVEITDAFSETISPSFKYGYKTKAAGTFEFKMTVGNFVNDLGPDLWKVKIASVTYF